jgi:type I restriction enzyme S subunit
MEMTAIKVTFPKYPAYKDSRVEWLGEIPEHWKIEPAKRCNKVIKELNKNRSNDNVLSLTLRGVVNNDLDNPEGLVPKDYATYQLFEKNDLVFKLIDLENISTSRVGIVHEKGIMSSAYIRLVTGAESEPKFAFYYYYSLYKNEVFNKLGSGVRSTLGPKDLLNLQFLKPSLSEQTAIANFLDDKTAKIDRAITQKEKIISLLKERKQIIIQDLVTGKKVWNPNQNAWTEPAEVKDSGVEWIGEIPEHWQVQQSQWLFAERKERARKDDIQLTSSQKFGVIPQKEYMEIEGRRVTVVEFNKEIQKHVEVGDFMISMRSFQGGIEYSNYRGCISSAYISLIPTKMVFSDFYKYLFKCQRYIEALQSTSNLVRDGQALRFENFKQVPLLIIPIDEQKHIAEYIEVQSAKIEKAIALQEQQIEKLKELKSTLIDSAVTGKLRVPLVQEIKVS